MVFVKVEKLRDDIELPKYTRDGDAGMDVRAAEEVILQPGETKIIPTGLRLAIPNGYEIQIRPRSGLSLKTGLRLPNSPGTIDSNYRGELGIIVQNTDEDIEHTIEKGDRIAQMVLNKLPKMLLQVVDNLDDTNRGDGGFGSSGIK